ncbi:hypothetical protein [Desulfosporosinus sp.]|uniref:hypothetical protein n=1 Tax=Desulfosporosinus sp. TaxID=157907 RepID=UPI0026214E95|nr:hypothetical protein [Desulfosporosinus sp.]
MDISPDPIKPLGEAIKEMLDDRTCSCDYYRSWEYMKNREKASELDRKIRKRLGEKTWRTIWPFISEIDHLQGELHAGLTRSCYELGFNDALQLANQIDEAGKGRRTIFN